MKKLFVIAVFAFFGTTLVALQSCQSSKSATASRMLKFNFEKGKSYDYDMITDIDQEVMGQKNEISMTAQYGLEVTGSNDGIVDITTTFNAFRLNMKVMGMTIEADTEKPLAADTSSVMNPLTLMSKLFHSIKGQKFTMKVNAEGKVLEVSGMEEMAKNIIDSLEMGDEFKETMNNSFKQQFNDASMKEQFERAFFIFPGKEVKVGDSWVKESSVPGGGAGSVKTTYTVDEIEGDMVILDMKSKIGGPDAGKTYGTQSGKMTVDSRSGLIMESDLDMNIEAQEEGASVKMVGKIRIRGRERK